MVNGLGVFLYPSIESFVGYRVRAGLIFGDAIVGKCRLHSHPSSHADTLPKGPSIIFGGQEVRPNNGIGIWIRRTDGDFTAALGAKKGNRNRKAVAVLAPANGKTKTGRIWTYVLDERPWQGYRAPAAYYRFSPDRKGERPQGHLAGFRGVIQAGAFSGYESLVRSEASSGQDPPRLLHAACWAYARRKFFDVFEATKSPIAEEALRQIGELYRIEAEISGRAAELRLSARQEHAAPILAELRTWLEEQRRRLSSKTALAKAIQYALTRWNALTRYAGDGRLAIDNNPAERSLRGIAITRKNFLFLGSRPVATAPPYSTPCLRRPSSTGSILNPSGRCHRPHGQGASDQPAQRTSALE